MTVDRSALLANLKGELGPLVDDLRARCDEHPDVDAPLNTEWQAAHAAGRTARGYGAWRDDVLTDVAVAWLLAGVFVRFCEDNGLVDTPLLGGPGERLAVAQGWRLAYFTENSGAGDREWLTEVVGRAAKSPGLAEVFGSHNPLWRLGPSADGARRLVNLWEAIDPTSGDIRHDFTDASLDTRFLGDLYQDLSESAKKQYALLQTPEFVEEFILERTLQPAIAEFGLDVVRLIDPTCGSGHFLLGAFDHLFPRLRERHAGEPVQATVQRTLDAIAGVDLNPAAAAIARFRLLVAALKASGSRRLADLPDFHVNVAVGDSLLHGRIPGQRLDIAGVDTNVLYQHAYDTEDGELARQLLRHRYHAVVGNPPYIVVRDAALNQAYRGMFDSCHRQYSLAVPFMERFFDLAVPGGDGQPAGFVGKITANSFMKREFGKKLIEQFLPTWDLTHVIDTSGAYIPGHGTPTVILFGRNQHPTTHTVRGVLGTRGEPSRPADPAKGVVWTSIAGLVDTPGAEDAFVTVNELQREVLCRHPWSIGGGGAIDLLDRLRSNSDRLASRVMSIGYTGQTNADDVMVVDDSRIFARQGISKNLYRQLVIGQSVRDWGFVDLPASLFPYADERLVNVGDHPALLKWLWPSRSVLWSRATFSKATYRDEGRTWWEWHQIAFSRLRPMYSISFAGVATHSQFSLDRSRRLFKGTAPVVQVSSAEVDDSLALLGLLNSSAACFWMQQVFHNKGGPGGGNSKDEKWHDFFGFDGSKLQELPVPDGVMPVGWARRLDDLASQRAVLSPVEVLKRERPSVEVLASAREASEGLTLRMITLQEELDWYVYGLYGLVEEDFTFPIDEVPPIALGERGFEIVMARQMAAGELDTTWFVRHGSTPITEIPAHWPQGYRDLVQRRIDRIEADRDIALIERPECKRRWNAEPWDKQQESALRGWLLDRLESPALWGEGRIRSCAEVADVLRRDADFMQGAVLYAGADVDVVALVSTLASAEAVPFLAAWRYSDSGLRKRAEWEATWELQRREDAGEDVGSIPVPPKYGKEDFRSASYWPLRGKLDVPKERFVSFPGLQRDNDATLLLGWAGWDHLQRAQALATWHTEARDRGADPESLLPVLAGLWELVPWLRQWHNDVDPVYGQRLGDFYADFTRDEAARISRTPDDLAAWRAPAQVRGRKAKS